MRLPQREVRSIEAPISVPPKNPFGEKIPNFGSDPHAIRSNGSYEGSGPDLGGEGTGIGGGNSAVEIRKPKNDDIEPPVVKPRKAPAILKISHVINGMAKTLITPRYPETAKAVHLTGQVQVQVTIDEDGNVIAADILSGHFLFRRAALDAARASKFTPTILSEQKVKVTGVIIYNFNG
jgi:TonB family protein